MYFLVKSILNYVAALLIEILWCLPCEDEVSIDYYLPLCMGVCLNVAHGISEDLVSYVGLKHSLFVII